MTVCFFCSEDKFTVEGKDVGFVTAVEVKRDASGFGDDWRLLYVRAYHNLCFSRALIGFANSG